MTSSQYDFETEYDLSTRRVAPENIYSTDPKRGGRFLDWRKMKEKIPESLASLTFCGSAERLVTNDKLRVFLSEVVWPEVKLRLRKDAPIHRKILPVHGDPFPEIKIRDEMISTMRKYKLGQRVAVVTLLQDTLSELGLVRYYPTYSAFRAGQGYI